MSDGDRDRALQVRVRRHRRVGILVRAREHDVDEGTQRCDRLVARVLHVQPVGGHDLVVARAAGMDLPAERAEQPLDRAMDVLVVRLEVVGADLREPCLHLGQLGVVEEAGGMQPPCVEPGALAVVRKQLRVFRLDVRPDLGRERRVDASRPERHSDHPSRSSRRLESVMSLSLSASWPIRSDAVNAVALRSMLSRSGW